MLDGGDKAAGGMIGAKAMPASHDDRISNAFADCQIASNIDEIARIRTGHAGFRCAEFLYAAAYPVDRIAAEAGIR